MDQDLFDIFEGNPQAGSDSDSDSDSVQSSKSVEKGKKRTADGGIKTSDIDGDIDVPDADAEQPSTATTAAAATTQAAAPSNRDSSIEAQDVKRRKTDEVVAEPVLRDTFETAASREVKADAGLDAEKEGSAESGPLVLSHNIQHQVALPPDMDTEYIPLSEHKPPEQPARTYNFKLDPFQSLSVASIERDESVLVSAHTSAGKTVVAEYAIAQCLKRNQRVIYTSPIKALSNQKYRDFEAIFGDVGLMTGDVTINPTAGCLVMTTEILRSMLYRGSEIMREVAWVVFDEIHYMRDKTRGVVWEETIILLPDKVRYVFLSATIPNAFQFAEWIAKLHHQPCHVVYTDFRPTPLQNYFYPTGSNGIYLVVDEKGVFKEKGFQNAMRSIEEAEKENTGAPRGGKGKKRGQQDQRGNDGDKKPIQKLVKQIIKLRFHPVIIFSFSKREVEDLAQQTSNMRFNNKSEVELVKTVCARAIESLPEADRELRQIQGLIPLLEKGIGVHHSGLLPIMKETIEILFQESLIKVLFATETFSIGLNMPAKTVVFTAVKKWDGVKNRPLTPSEYIQMSGRAGRRGLDSRGIVIMMIDDKMEPEVCKEIVVGQQDRLNSAFYLGYNMILNLLRIEAVSPEFMLERCFFQFQNAASVPQLEKELISLQQERDAMAIADEATIKDYYNIRQQLNTYHEDMRAFLQQPSVCNEFLQPGRLIQIHNPDVKEGDVSSGQDFGWGVVLSTCKRKAKDRFVEEEYSRQESWIVDVFLPVAFDSTGGFIPSNGRLDTSMPAGTKPAEEGNKTRYAIVPCLFKCIKSIGQVRIFLAKDAMESERSREHVSKSLVEVRQRFPDGLPSLDPLENMGIEDETFKKVLRKIEVLESRLLSNPLHESPLLPQLWEQFSTKNRLGEEIKEKKKAIAKAHSIAQLDELKARKRVLRRLGFIDSQEILQLKARVACEISSTEGHELLLSELLFDRFFNEMTPEICAAVLSCFVFDEIVKDAETPKEFLEKPLREVIAKAKIIEKISIESKLDIAEGVYVKSLKSGLMQVTYAWTSGATFGEICKMTAVFEGSLIRVFRRLEELLRQMAQGAKVMGSDDLVQKFEESLKKLRRDIVASQSLYL